MRRRGVTVILGALITAMLAVGVMAIPMPYVVLYPGPTYNTLGSDKGKEVIRVGAGGAVSSSTGQIRLTTVEVSGKVELVYAIRGWLSDQEAVVPREQIYPREKSRQQVEQQNAEAFTVSQSSAETVALRELGYPVQALVMKVTEDGPAAGLLQKDDLITAVDDVAVDGPTRLTELIRAKPAGTALRLAYTRAGKAGTATVTTKASEAGGPPRIGVEVGKKQQAPFTVDIDLDAVGGPSAGLMFALGIIDKLTPADLTGGKIIAGTGTIDDDGNVGPIGGIPQKLVGAKEAGAQIFLVPEGNCAEAVRNAVPGLPMAKVATADEALAAVNTFASGGTPTSCPAA